MCRCHVLLLLSLLGRPTRPQRAHASLNSVGLLSTPSSTPIRTATLLWQMCPRITHMPFYAKCVNQQTHTGMAAAPSLYCLLHERI
jgi:hypothetical protein